MFKTSEFIISIENLQSSPNQGGFCEYAFIGRSNVGKSSLINALCQKKKLARVSSDPGKTITINYYLLNQSFYLVDLPGYGFARRDKATIQKLQKMTEHYLTASFYLKKCFLLVDLKVGPTDKDILMYQRLQALHREVVVVATKADKPNKNQLKAKIENIKKQFPASLIIVTSSYQKTGIKELQQAIIEDLK